MKPRDRSKRFFSRPLAPGAWSAQARTLPRWLWLVLGAWLVWVTVASDHSFWRIAQLRHQIAAAERDTKQVRDDNDALEAQVSDPESQRFRAEEIARTQHGWAAPGEVVYRFRGDSPDTSAR